MAVFVYLAGIDNEGTLFASESSMLLKLHLPPATETKLAASAAASKKDVAAFALQVLEAHLAIEPQSLRQILRPIHEAIRGSGILRAQLDSLLADELVAVRNERSGV